MPHIYILYTCIYVAASALIDLLLDFADKRTVTLAPAPAFQILPLSCFKLAENMELKYLSKKTLSLEIEIVGKLYTPEV